MTRRREATADKRGRGRPKGSGLDDAKALATITAMLAADRAMRPTTAIKRAGVTNPSTIRRLRDKLREAGESPARVPAAALASSRPQTVTAELPETASPIIDRPAVDRPAAATAPASDDSAQPSSRKHPPLAAETEKRTREALLLAAYLDAMTKSLPAEHKQAAPIAPVEHRRAPQAPPADAPIEPRPAPAAPPPAGSPTGHSQQPQQNSERPAGTAQTPPPPRSTFAFPGMPPFLQPFQPPPQPPKPATSPLQQMEGMKLAVEAMTSMAKLQLHITENAFSYSPLALMLQGQAMVGQMLLASFTGQLDAMKPKKPPGAK